LGLEIPFTKSHIFSFELYSHSWLAKPSKKDNIIDKHFVKINDNLYAQVGLSGVLRYILQQPHLNLECVFTLVLWALAQKKSIMLLMLELG
jgi:hypothetical protein